MATRTSSQNGNWSASSTWGGDAAPGIGDTATINHTVTVDQDTTVGTSPNDTTTLVVTVASGKALVVSAGRTLTLRGNAQDTLATITMEAGSNIVFDNSASGGSPVYKWTNQISAWAVNGTAQAPCSISAISGQAFTFPWANAFATETFTYCNFSRMAASTGDVHDSATSLTITNCSFTGCGKWTLSRDAGAGAIAINISNNAWVNSTGTECLGLGFTTGAGTRVFEGNVLDKGMTDTSIGFDVTDNYVGGSWTGSSTTRTNSVTGNVFVTDGLAQAGNGMRFNNTVSGNYFLCTSGNNPHIVQIHALDGDVSFDHNIFEVHGTQQTDTGDCVFPFDTGGHLVSIDYNIVLPNSKAGETTTSGVLITSFNEDASRTFRARHNTCFVGGIASGGGTVNLAEGHAGHAGEMSEWKSNLCWSNDGTGNQVARLSGTTNAILPAAGADYNWRHNIAAGDNGRGYNDVAGNLDLWDGGAADGNNAADAGVDANGGEADPRFIDESRNSLTWVASRGYGSSISDVQAALGVSQARRDDLIAYVREGFAPTNAVLRDAGHDGVTVGAVEWMGSGGRSRLFSSKLSRTSLVG